MIKHKTIELRNHQAIQCEKIIQSATPQLNNADPRALTSKLLSGQSVFVYNDWGIWVLQLIFAMAPQADVDIVQ